MDAWHVVISRPQQEVRASIELANQDFEVFLPILESKPMFPRYLFVRFDRDLDAWGVIKNTRGCSDILKNGFLPAPVPELAMAAIRNYRPPEPIPDTPEEFTKGQAVRIIEGPCAGIEGLFQADEKRRVYALLEICGKPIRIPRQSIRAASRL